MPVIKLTISKDLRGFSRDFHKMLDEAFAMPRPSLMSGMAWMPAMDIYEDSDFLYVVADLAGVEVDNLELAIEGRFLRVSGNRKPPVAIARKRFFQMEVEYGPFERVVRIPFSIVPENVEARLENGLLLVRLRKERPEKVTIQVK
jgi:HSP20 family protein